MCIRDRDGTNMRNVSRMIRKLAKMGRTIIAVSYTHLVVYKRQILNNAPSMGELEARAKAGEQVSLSDVAARCV